ncbi:MAG: FAD-binding protein [Actinobacteria bacterium]|nr:FAD-binding protein [Actinomycetota bacterium]
MLSYSAAIDSSVGISFRIIAGDPDPIVEQNLIGTDWKVQFEEAIADGRIKKADSLEELCEMMNLDSEIIMPAIDKWNAACETKQDYDIYPYPPSWMNPVAEGPFYGAKTGGILGKCLTGLRVDAEMRIIGPDNRPIPGLYANMMTAGGACGESSYCGNLVNTSILGGCGLSWTTGYMAAKTAMADNV